MSKRKWTKHGLTDSMLKQLAAAANRDSGSLFPGVGYGAPSSRGALSRKGLIKEIDQPSTYGGKDTVINSHGRVALTLARNEGW